LNSYFERNLDEEVWITDEDISLNESREVFHLLNAVVGKNVLVHVRVDSKQIMRTKQFLEDAAIEETREKASILKWLYSKDDYLIELMKRMPDWSVYKVRFYEDGNGVIVYFGKEHHEIYYFRLKSHLRDSIVCNIDKRIDEIVNKPVWTGEDDRYFGFSVHLKFNIYYKYPEADKKLKQYQEYEDVDYSDDEFRLNIAKQLLSAPEVKTKWLSMHNTEGEGE